MNSRFNSAFTIKKSTFKLSISFIVSFFYSLLLASLSNELFRDRINYIYYAKYLEERLSNYSKYEVVFNEPLFYLYNYILGLFFEVDLIPHVSVFIISFATSFLIIYKSRNILLSFLGIALLTFVPYTFHLQLVILRQGIATAILLWNVSTNWNNKKKFYIISFLLCFIHTSFIIVLLTLLADQYLSKFISSIKLRLVIIGAFLYTSSSVVLSIGESLGVRQASSEHLLINSNGGGGFILFSFVLLFFILRGVNNVSQNKYGYLSLLGLTIYLAFYFTVPISGRIIGTFLPFLYVYIVSSNNMKVYFAAIVFLSVNLYLFQDSITNNSLTLLGGSVFSSFKSFITYIYLL